MAGISSSAVSSGPISASGILPERSIQLTATENPDVAALAVQSVTNASLAVTESADLAVGGIFVAHSLAVGATETPDAATGSISVLSVGALALTAQEAGDVASIALTLNEGQTSNAREAQRRRLRLALSTRRRGEQAEPLSLYTTLTLAAREGSDRAAASAALSWPPPDGEEEAMIREYFEAMGFELVD